MMFWNFLSGVVFACRVVNTVGYLLLKDLAFLKISNT